MKKNVIFCLLISIFFSGVLLLSGCGEKKLISDWRDRQISIDGKYKDWGGAESYYDERAKVIINLVNDENYLYISIITRNREIEAKVMNSGLVVWFDPEGKNKKTFGIQFPTGLKDMGIALEEERDMTKDWRDQKDTSVLIDREKERAGDTSFNKKLELLEKLQDKLEIVKGDFDFKKKGKRPKPPVKEKAKDKKGPNKEFTLEEAAKLGIEAKVGRENDYFVYELKVPLVKSAEHPYAIEVKKGKPVGLGLENSRFGMGRRSPNWGDDEDKAPPGMDSPDSRSSMFSSECFPLWATVTLSSKP